ncbi:MAG: Gfo/Idh/MocA family oxidoreductase [Chloroflexi bacterium]|nr:Gfo/Idh/MocA family oxidoreductase [Chloroflexota bacterium]
MVYRAGLIGCGGVSRSHSAGLQAARNVELVTLADVYEPNLETAGKAYGVDRLYTDFREMIEREQLDIIAICTQAPQHAPIAIAAAVMGVKGIICEKPIALTPAEADAMIAACDRAGTKLAINHQTRMIPNTFLVEQILKEGVIGDLRAARLIDKGGRPAGNSLMELLTHVFDLLRIYAGDPAWVSAHLTVGASGPGRQDEPQRLAAIDDVVYSQTAWPRDRDCGLVLGDRCNATFGFGPRENWHNGLTASLESYFQPIRSSTGEPWHPNLELVGTDGILFLGGTSNHVDVYLHRGAWAPPGKLERFDAPPREIAPGPYQERGQQAPYHTGMVEELVAAIEQGREHRSSGRAGRWALEMIMGVYESHRRGGARVELPLAYRGHPLQRWLEEDGRPLPPKPEARVKVLNVPAPVG